MRCSRLFTVAAMTSLPEDRGSNSDTLAVANALFLGKVTANCPWGKFPVGTIKKIKTDNCQRSRKQIETQESLTYERFLFGQDKTV